jgi:acyl dehydratase
MSQRYYEDVNIGDELEPFQRKTDFMNWNRFAAVNDEFIYIHMDDAAGEAAGQGGAFGMGNLRQSYLLNMLRTFAGDEGQVRELSLQYRVINKKNDVLTTSGRVVAKTFEEGEYRVHLETGVRNQLGQETAPGTAIVVLPSRSGAV